MKALEDMSTQELSQLFPIILEDYNPEYTGWYMDEKKKLEVILKHLSVARISHIGSTSVKGLRSKPCVDILLEFSEPTDFDTIINELKNNGWILMNSTPKIFIGALNKGYTPSGFEKKIFHLHIRPYGDWDELYFRDYLKIHPDIASEYANLKLILKEKFEYDRDAYTMAKTDFIKLHTKAAREEFGEKYK